VWHGPVCREAPRKASASKSEVHRSRYQRDGGCASRKTATSLCPSRRSAASDGSPKLNFEDKTFDRFVADYVHALLTLEDSRALLQEAWRVLPEGGIIELASLTHRFTPASRVVERIWIPLHVIRPTLVGGCRPISLLELMTKPEWRVRYRQTIPLNSPIYNLHRIGIRKWSFLKYLAI
jgi:SAM-dependent methyltransferase